MNNEPARPHSIFVQDRSRAEITGIREVESFNENGIDLISFDGGISVEGESLRIEEFSVETGKILVLGRITGVFYYDKQEKNSTKRSGWFPRRSK